MEGNEMIQVAIVEDNAQERIRIRALLNNIAQQESVQLSISEFPTGYAFLDSFHSEYDMILMDIEMPGMDGMETARAIRRTDTTVLIIFITNLAQYAICGYEVEALDFIVKPINPCSFSLKMKRAISRTAKRTDEVIQIRTERETFSVPISSIRYLEVSGHYVIYHLTGGTLTEYTTLKDAEQKINKRFFVRCNRCYLVNLRYITSVSKDTVILGKDALAISRPQKKSFLLAFSEFLGGSV